MTFFTQDFIDFFAELKDNNQREWMEANKKRYEKSVKKPFEAFVAHLIREVQGWWPELDVAPKDCIFRINRDIRFSNDKRPYKENTGAVLAPGGRKDMLPSFYIQLGADELWVGGGVYMPDKAQVAAIRTALADGYTTLDKALGNKDFVKLYGSLQGERNKVLPKELKEAAVQQPLLYMRQYYYLHVSPDVQRMLQPDFADWVVNALKAGQPVNESLGYLLD